MTTLICWAAIDDRSTSAVYIASDSRLSWGSSGVWDSGRKIFASEKFPEVLGYTGDALFCTQVLSQVISFVDTCEPLRFMTNFDEKHGYIGDLVKRAFSSYPTQFCLPNFSIVYLTRIGSVWGACTFAWDLEQGWGDAKVHTIPMTWDQVHSVDPYLRVQARAVMFVCAGSGGEEFRDYYDRSEWLQKLPLLSRGIFGAFSDFITSESKKDRLTGGWPQLSCLYRKNEAQKIGFAEGDCRYLYGIKLAPSDYRSRVRWVNRTFENCAARSGARIPGEQPQPAPFARTAR